MAASRRVGAARPDAAASLAESYPISLIVPVHNGAADLGRCLDAIRANDLRSVDVIVVDDGSTDETAAVVARRAADWPQVTSIRLPECRGPSAARNAGVEAARRAFVFFVDADVILPSSAARWIRETLQLYSHRPDVVGVLGVYSDETPTVDFWSRYKNLYTAFLYATTPTLTPFVHTPVYCIARDELLRLGGFDPDLRRGEDFRLGLKLAIAGKLNVIERRLQVVHLKKYTLRSLLAEDWRRVRQLRRLSLDAEERRAARGAHRFRRLLAVALPLPTAGAAASALWWPAAGFVALGLGLLFVAAQLPFVRYVRRRAGAWFALKAALFSWLEMGWAQLALLSSLLSSRVEPGGQS